MPRNKPSPYTADPLDAAAYVANASQRAPACPHVRHVCSGCCLRKAARAGGGVGQLRHLLRTAARGAALNVAVVGNSVARFNNFGVTRGFLAELQERLPKTRVDVAYVNVAGGFEPDHLYYCGLSAPSLINADLILLHYHAPRGGRIYEKVLRRMLQLPRQPVLVYVAHCTMADFSAYRDWAVLRDRGKHVFRTETEGQGYLESVRKVEERLVRAYDITFVSTCTAFRTMLGAVDQTDRIVDDSFEPTWKGWRAKMARRWLPMPAAVKADRHRSDDMGAWNATALTCQPGRQSRHSSGSRSGNANRNGYWSGNGHSHLRRRPPPFAHVTDLMPRFFAKNDHQHYGPFGSALQGCLVAHAVLDAHAPRAALSVRKQQQKQQKKNAAARSLPGRVLTPAEARLLCGTGPGQGKHCDDDSNDEPAFCANTGAGTLEPAPASHGWSLVKNAGAGGRKSWLEATAAGATLHVVTPQPARAFFIEVYQHHNLGLGRVHVSLPGLQSVASIDACCASPGCPGVPVGKGRYTTRRIPASGFLAQPTRNVTIRVVGRASHERSSCAVEGSKVNIASVIGLLAPQDEHQTSH